MLQALPSLVSVQALSDGSVGTREGYVQLDHGPVNYDHFGPLGGFPRAFPRQLEVLRILFPSLEVLRDEWDQDTFCYTSQNTSSRAGRWRCHSKQHNSHLDRGIRLG